MAAQRSALFVIDIQHELAGDPATQIPHADRIKAAGDKILSVARTIMDSHRERSGTSSTTIVFVQHEEKPEEGTLVKGSEPWKLVFDPREGVAGEVLVPKTHRDTLESNPDLATRLRAEGIQQIVAFGIQSENCVEGTCLGALAAGFDVTLLSGAHSTYDIEGKTAEEIEREVEKRLEAEGARITPWNEAVTTWEAEQRVF